MKCFACGYSYNDKNQKEYEIETMLGNGGTMKPVYKYKNGGKPFIELTGMENKFRANGEYHAIRTTLYACPNCGTVRMDTGC